MVVEGCLRNTIRHDRHEGLYWFGPPESKTLHPFLGVVLSGNQENVWKIWSAYAFPRGVPRAPYIG
jgi:hypothetical protein